MADAFLAGGIMEARIPPQSIEAEQAVLGAIMKSTDREAFDSVGHVVRSQDFYRDAHRVIYEAILNVANSNINPDMIVVIEELNRMQKLENVGGIQYITKLVDEAVAVYNLEEHARIVMEKAQLRRLIDAASKIEGMGYKGEEKTPDILDKAERMILDVGGQTHSESSFKDLSNILIESLERINELQKYEGVLTGLSTGFRDLDNITSGLQKSDLILVAARPSMGKTAFTLNIAQNVALRSRKPVAFFSLEMSQVQLVNRILASVAGIDSNRIRNGNLTPEDWEQVFKAQAVMAGAPLYIDDTPGLTPQLMLKKLRRLKKEQGLSLVIVDYIQLMEFGGAKTGDNRQQEISAISRQLKLIARELDVPLIALSQLSRSVESRQDKRPILSDLRESGSLEQDADIVTFLNRVNYQELEDSNEGEITEIIIRKHRNGKLGVIKLFFEGQHQRFRDLANSQFDVEEL